MYVWLLLLLFLTRSGKLWTQKLKPHLLRTQSLKGSPFKAWSRSVYSHTCYAYCQGFLPCLFLPFWSIHLHFFQNLNTGSCVGPQNKIGHPVGCRFLCWVPRNRNRLKKNLWLVVKGLVKWITLRWSEVCVQPWYNPLWLTWLKAPTN